MIRGSIAGVALAIFVTACGAGGGASSAAVPCCDAGPPSVTPAPGKLTVFAAASLKAVLDEAVTAYTAANPGPTIEVSTDSSAALETQIEQGAPADLFLSADISNPQRLADRGLAAGNPVVFAANELTLVVPKDNPAGLSSPRDLGMPGLRIIAAGDAVPITKYATQLVANLEALPGYPRDLVAAYNANVVSREDNVNAVIAKIELGEGDAAITYVTDAAASDHVATIAVPEAANVPATYAGVVVKASANTATAHAFLAWLAGPAGETILTKLGFLPPPP